MSFTAPIGLIALAAIPAVLILHLFRRKFRERRVGGLFLFAPDALRAAAGRKRTRLIRSASLWCELLLALVAALWLGGLEFGASTQPVEVVFVLDDSASMASESGGESAAARARARVSALVAELPESTTATVVLSGTRPEILLGPRAPLPLVDRVLRDWSPWRPNHDLSIAMDLGAELAAGASDVHVLTDRPVDARSLPPRSRLHSVGVPLDNVAILSARRERSADERERLFVDLCSFGRDETSAELLLFAVGGDAVRELARQDVELEPDKPVHLALSVAATDLPLVVQISQDALAIDNVFTLFARPERVVQVAVEWPDELARALLVDEVLAALPATRRVATVDDAHWVFGPQATNPNSPHELRLVSEAPGAPEAVRDTWIGPYLIERRDPLCDGLTLDGVVWTSPRVETDAFPLVSAGERALLTRDESVTNRISLTLYLDPLRSNFAGSPDWPILLTNVCEAVRETLPGAESPNVLVGNTIRWRRAADAVGGDIDLVDPLGQRRPGRGLRLVTWDAQRSGEHVLEQEGRVLGRFSVNFADATESDLRNCATAEVEADAMGPHLARGAGSTSDPHQASRGNTERQAMAWLLLLLAALDWFLLRGRGAPGAPPGGASVS